MKLLTITLAGAVSLFSGSAFTSVMGKQETKGNLILYVTVDGNEKTIYLEGYSVLQYEKVSISGVVTTDDEGKIVGYRDVKILGAPGKLSSASGIITDKRVDVTLKGKAAGAFDFKVHYQATPCVNNHTR